MTSVLRALHTVASEVIIAPGAVLLRAGRLSPPYFQEAVLHAPHGAYQATHVQAPLSEISRQCSVLPPTQAHHQ